MTTSDPISGPPASWAGIASSRRQEELAEAAWRHLVNRHDLAQALDELGTTASDTQQLLVAVEQLGSRIVKRPVTANSKPSAPPAIGAL